MNIKVTTRLIVALVTMAVLGICTPQTLRAASSSKQKAAQHALETRLERLERANRQLEQQNRAIQRQLSAQSEELGALKQQFDKTSRPVAALEQDVPHLQQRVASVENRRDQLPIEVGFRTGWSESPYKMPGGFFYSAFLNHRLLDHEDGIPGGFVTGELLAGATFGNHAVTSANLLSQVAPQVGPQSTWLQTLQIVPTVQYHVDPALFGYEQWSWAKPYLLAGPAIYISMLSTPIVVKGDLPGAGYRHTDADLQGGGAFGFGTELALGRLTVPPIQKILNRSFVGAEWRYNQMGNGEGFNQYTGSVAFGW